VQNILMLLADGLAVFPLEFDGRVKHFDVLDGQFSDLFQSRCGIPANLGRMTARDLGEVVSFDSMQIDQTQKKQLIGFNLPEGILERNAQDDHDVGVRWRIVSRKRLVSFLSILERDGSAKLFRDPPALQSGMRDTSQPDV
jgi:hypothetical protein